VLTEFSPDSVARGGDPAAHQRAGAAALARGDWAAARDAFLAAGDAPEALEGLGWAGYWLSDEALTLRAREAAYRGYRARGGDAAAGRVAAWLAGD
jgi:LuxR family maltose regulon positive regulatory protein